MRLAATLIAAIAVASCVGTPPVEKVAAYAEGGACKALPEGVTCDCVISTAHAEIPNIKVDRSSDETGSRLGRSTIGALDPRIAVAVENAKKSCAAGKAVV